MWCREETGKLHLELRWKMTSVVTSKNNEVVLKIFPFLPMSAWRKTRQKAFLPSHFRCPETWTSFKTYVRGGRTIHRATKFPQRPLLVSGDNHFEFRSSFFPLFSFFFFFCFKTCFSSDWCSISHLSASTLLHENWHSKHELLLLV